MRSLNWIVNKSVSNGYWSMQKQTHTCIRWQSYAHNTNTNIHTIYIYNLYMYISICIHKRARAHILLAVQKKYLSYVIYVNQCEVTKCVQRRIGDFARINDCTDFVHEYIHILYELHLLLILSDLHPAHPSSVCWLYQPSDCFDKDIYSALYLGATQSICKVIFLI